MRGVDVLFRLMFESTAKLQYILDDREGKHNLCKQVRESVEIIYVECFILFFLGCLGKC